MGGGVFEETYEGCGDGELWADGDEGGKDASVAVREILDFEGEVTFLVRVRCSCMWRETVLVSLGGEMSIDRVWDGNGDCSGCE